MTVDLKDRGTKRHSLALILLSLIELAVIFIGPESIHVILKSW